MQRSVWKDRDFRQLGSDARLLFLWSWTNPQASICGLYVATAFDLQLALAEPPADWQRVLTALEELDAKPLLLWHEETEMLWIPSRVRHANRSPKVARAMQKEVDGLPASPLLERFIDQYGKQLGLEIGG